MPNYWTKYCGYHCLQSHPRTDISDESKKVISLCYEDCKHYLSDISPLANPAWALYLSICLSFSSVERAIVRDPGKFWGEKEEICFCWNDSLQRGVFKVVIIYSLDMTPTPPHSGISLSQQSSVWGALSCFQQSFPLTAQAGKHVKVCCHLDRDLPQDFRKKLCNWCLCM